MQETHSSSVNIAVPPVVVYCHAHGLGTEAVMTWSRPAQIPFQIDDIGRDADAREAGRAPGPHIPSSAW